MKGKNRRREFRICGEKGLFYEAIGQFLGQDKIENLGKNDPKDKKA